MLANMSAGSCFVFAVVKDIFITGAGVNATPASAAGKRLMRPVADTNNTSRFASALRNWISRINPFGAISPVLVFFAINLPFTLTASNTFVITLSFYDLIK
jgi:hypothetical protein